MPSINNNNTEKRNCLICFVLQSRAGIPCIFAFRAVWGKCFALSNLPFQAGHSSFSLRLYSHVLSKIARQILESSEINCQGSILYKNTLDSSKRSSPILFKTPETCLECVKRLKFRKEDHAKLGLAGMERITIMCPVPAELPVCV